MNGIKGIVPQNQNDLNLNLNREHLHCENCMNRNNTADCDTIVQHFLSEYYRGTSNIGWNSVIYLFSTNCNVVLKNKTIGNAHNLLNHFSTEYIKRANYGNLSSKWVLASSDTLVVNVFGTFQFVSFMGVVSNVMSFSETFVLKVNAQKNITCNSHMIDF